MLLFNNPTANAVQLFIEPFLEKGEALRKYTLCKSLKALGKGLAALGIGITAAELGLDIELDALSGLQEFTLICLTNQRLIFGGVLISMGRGKTGVFPRSEEEELLNIPLSDIKSANYKSGFSRGSLSILLEDNDEILFSFHWRATGRHAKEMARMITSEISQQR